MAMAPEELEAARARMRAIGSKGGRSTVTKHGRAHFSKIGAKGAQGTKKRWGKVGG